MADNPNYPVGTVSVGWTDKSGAGQLHVFSTDGYEVIERYWNGSGWSTGDFKQPGSQVSATGFMGEDGFHIRVYCTSGNKTTEWCKDGDGAWFQGGYTTE